jgi:uncharacterized protein YjbI with pentapeptide repeats
MAMSESISAIYLVHFVDGLGKTSNGCELNGCELNGCELNGCELNGCELVVSQ